MFDIVSGYTINSSQAGGLKALERVEIKLVRSMCKREPRCMSCRELGDWKASAST
ncbi:MAG: hypothetical protein WC782_13780 [Methylococcaceae bacterium]